MAELEESLLEKTGWSFTDLEKEVQERQSKFAGLLTREGALELICLEQGLVSKEEKQIVFDSLADARTRPNATVNVKARVFHAFSPKKFTRTDAKGQERQGRVCNLMIKDASGEATLVLWGNDVDYSRDIERGDAIEIRGAFVKSASPLELHSSMLTRVTKIEGDVLPQVNKKPASLSTIAPGGQDTDFYGRVLKVGKASEFTRINKKGGQEKGLVCDCTLTDGKTSVRLVGWDDNARQLERAVPGDAIKVEGAYVKADSKNGVEAHAGWQGRILLSPKSHSLAPTQQMLAEMYPHKLLRELADGQTAIVNARVVELSSATAIVKCTNCGARSEQTATACSSCGLEKLRTLLVVKAVLDDGFSNASAVFFGNEAMDFLGLKQLIDPSTVLELKRADLVGREVQLVISVKTQNAFTDYVVKQVVDLNPSAQDQTQELSKRLEN